MKKNFLLALALVLTALTASAQKITNQSLQGHWNMTAFSTSGIQFELATHEIVLSPEMKSLINGEAMKEMEEGLKQAAEQFKDGFVDFDGVTMKMGMAGGSETNMYTITEKEGKQFLSLRMPDGNMQELPVSIQDNRLSVTVDPAQSFCMIFTKG